MAPKVFVRGDHAYFLDPLTNERVSVPVEDIQAALEGQLIPLDQSQAQRSALIEGLEGPEGQFAAGVQGLARGATLGLSDLLAPSTQVQTALAEANPWTSQLSELGGTIGGAFLPGAPLQLAGRGAAAAGRAIGAGGRLAKAAGAATEDILVGGAIGAGQAVSDIALTPEMGPEDAALNFLEHTGTGALTGLAIGGFARGLMGVGRKLRRTADAKMAEQVEKGMAQRRALEADLAAAKWEPAARAKVRKDKITGLRGQQANATTDIGIITSEISVAEQELANVLAKKGVGLQSSKASIKLRRANLRLRRAQDRLDGLKNQEAALTKEPMIRPTDSTKIAKIEAQLANLTSKVQLRKAGLLADIGSAAVRYGLNASAMGAIPGAALGSTLTSRGAQWFGQALAPLGKRAGTWVASLGRGARAGGVPLIAALAGKIAPGAKIGAIAGMTDKELTTIVKALADTTPQEITDALNISYPTEVPAGVRASVTDSLIRATDFLRQWVPPPGHEKIIVGQEGPAGLPRVAMKAIRAVLDPDTVPQDLGKEELVRAQVEAWEQVYPEALMQMRDILRAELATAKAEGKKLTRSYARQMALILADDSVVPVMFEPRSIRMFQQMHAMSKEAEQPQGKKPMKIAKSSMTMAQRISEGV